MKSFKILTTCEIYPADHVTPKKVGVTKAVSSLLQICVFCLYIKFGLMNFFYKQALGRAQIR